MMTELEALKEALFVVSNDMDDALDEKRKAHSQEVHTVLEALIATVEKADTDLCYAQELATETLIAAGRVPTFWVSVSWVVEYMSDHHMPPDEDELADVLITLQLSQDVGSSESAAMVLDEWMQNHWQV